MTYTSKIPIVIKLNVVTGPVTHGKDEWKSRVYQLGKEVFECVAPTRQEAQKEAHKWVYNNYDVPDEITWHNRTAPNV
jgi:hypothetical protein